MLNKLFSFSGTIDRRWYVAIAFFGVVLKHVVDVSTATLVFHREWSPLNYLVPLGVPVQLSALTRSDQIFLGSMLAIALPFAWVGLAITAKRFRTIGWPAWTVVLFFVPIANIVSFAIAAAWPENPQLCPTRSPRWLARIVPSDELGTAAFALVVSAALGLGFVVAGTLVWTSYGWGLFAAIPFCQGALAAFLNGVHGKPGVYRGISVALLSSFLTMAAVFAVAIEGAICIAMAAPIWLALTAIGALFGDCLQRQLHLSGGAAASLIVLVLSAPVVMGAERMIPREAPIYVTETAIIVNAPPMKVWRNVIGFPQLPPPTEAIFRLGISYPERARIVGSGVGAVRYCEFSSGDFVEPITSWKPGKLLAFRVVRNPEPMKELSLYHDLQAPHLRGFMVSQMGEFKLEALPGGRTRLVGTTWYRHHLWPAAYWVLFSDAIIHRIHLRVLEHIKRLSEL